MTSPGSADRYRAGLVAWTAGVALAAVLYRSGRVLTFDGYHYCEFAKRYATGWPTAFGNHWPCGYPLLGGLLGRIGVPAFEALCLVSLLALAILAALADSLVRPLPRRELLLGALASTPVVGVQLFGNLTELPFAAALLGLGVALATPGRPSRWWLAAACALIALGLRYAGVIAYAILWIWLVLQNRPLRRQARLAAALVAAACSTLLAAVLLVWNLRATGHLSGAPREAAEQLGLAAWPRHVGDLGWSPVSALMLGRLRELAGGDRWPALALGWLSSLVAAAVCLQGWFRPRFPWVRSLALVTLAYGLGMTVLRSIGTFDALYNGRDFLPALFPFGLIVAAQYTPLWPRLVGGACAAVLAMGAVSAARGLSREVAGDVRPAVALLRQRLGPTDGVQINDQAFSLAAYVPQPTFRAWPGSWNPDLAQRFLVVAAAPVDRRGTPGAIDPAWRALAARLVDRSAYRPLLETPALLVLEHREALTGPGP